MEWLLHHGAKVSDMDNLGGTPVHDAAEQGHVRTHKLMRACVVVTDGGTCLPSTVSCIAWGRKGKQQLSGLSSGIGPLLIS